MPLSEVPQMVTRGNRESTQSRMPNCSPDLAPFMPDQGFVELLWENGQIVMQGQSNRPNKRSFTNTFTSHTAKFQEKDGRDAIMPKAGQFGTADSVFNDLSHSVPSAHIGLNTQDDDMVPWLSYPIEDPLQNDYCSEFLNEFPGFNQNSLSNNNNSVPAEQSSNLEDGHGSRSLAGGSDPSRIRTSQLFQLSQQSQSSATATNSRSTELCIAKQDAGTSNPVNPSSNMGFMNFPHFSRPIARAKSNLQGTDKLKCHEKGSTTASSKPVESTVINTASGLKSPSVIQGQSSTVPFNEESKETAKTSNRLLNHVTHHSSTVGTSVALGRQEVEKGTEAVVASSSVCSANSAGPESNDCKYTNKRKCLEGEDSGYQSEDVEDESVGLKKPASGRGASAKRTRAAEVHNLSERRRRDRINEKMRALQELIPNCNKVDKASMLDEAIEYLKTLQLQVQIMSMGSGLCMPPMMLPAGMQHLRPHPMTHFAPMGVNMGFGYGMGMVDMHRSPFACPSMPPGPGLPGSTGLQMFGIPGQGLHVPMPQPPPFASSLSSHSAQGVTTTSPLPVTDVTPSSDSKNQEQRNLSLEINTSTRELQNQTSNQSPVVQMSNQTSHASQN